MSNLADKIVVIKDGTNYIGEEMSTLKKDMEHSFLLTISNIPKTNFDTYKNDITALIKDIIFEDIRIRKKQEISQSFTVEIPTMFRKKIG